MRSLRVFELEDRNRIDRAQIGEGIRKWKVAWRNLIHRMRLRDDRAKNLAMTGIIEPLPATSDQVMLRMRVLIDLDRYPEHLFMGWIAARWARRYAMRIGLLQPEETLAMPIIATPRHSRGSGKQFYQMLQRTGGFRLLRFQINPQRRSEMPPHGKHQSKYMEAMPVVIG